MYTSSHVFFNESNFPFHTIPKNTSTPSSSIYSNNVWFSNLLYLHSTNQDSTPGPFVTPTQSNPVSTHSTSSSPSFDIPQSSPIVPIAPNPIPCFHFLNLKFSTVVPHTIIPIVSSTNQHPMTTRPKSGITKPKLCYEVTLDHTYTQPPTYKIASTYPKVVCNYGC